MTALFDESPAPRAHQGALARLRQSAGKEFAVSPVEYVGSGHWRGSRSGAVKSIREQPEADSYGQPLTGVAFGPQPTIVIPLQSNCNSIAIQLLPAQSRRGRGRAVIARPTSPRREASLFETGRAALPAVRPLFRGATDAG